MKRLLYPPAVAFCALLAVSATAAFRPPVAVADPGTPYEVVATIHPPSGSAAQPQIRTVDASTLQSQCTTLLPDNTGVYQSGQTTPFDTTIRNWSLAEVLSCGMGIPLSPGLDVQVYSPGKGEDESPLSVAQLTEPSAWDQNVPSGSTPNALPMIDTDGQSDAGSGNLFTYLRPWEGPGDENSADEVWTSSGRINVDVYPNIASLSVSPTATTDGLTTQFAASVTEANQTASLPASELTWHWSFGDGSASTAPDPSHTYAVPGTYSVTATATFTPLGLPGTGSIGVTVGATTSTTKVNPGTGGSKHGKSPNGPAKSSGKTPGARNGHHTGTTHRAKRKPKPRPKRHRKRPRPRTRSEPSGGLNASGGTGNGAGTGTGSGASLGASGAGTGLGATGSVGTAPTSAGQVSAPGAVTTAPSAASTAHRHPPRAHPRPLPEPLSGVLVSAVSPRGGAAPSNAGSGSLANAPAARAKAPTPISTAVIAGAAVLLLLGFGVAREIHHGRRPRPRRVPAWFGRRPRPSA